jgi:hypothetical protein
MFLFTRRKSQLFKTKVNLFVLVSRALLTQNFVELNVICRQLFPFFQNLTALSVNSFKSFMIRFPLTATTNAILKA